MDTALSPSPPLSEYPGIPGILGRSQDHPGMDTAHPPPPPPPCLSILGFLGYLDDPGIIPGWTQLTTPPCLSILGFLGYSDDPGIIPGWTQLTTPLSEYPGIPGILGRSWDHPGMDTAHHPPCLSILGFLGSSKDRPSIPGIPGYSDRGGVSCVHPEMIPGSSEYPRNPGILRQGGGGG